MPGTGRRCRWAAAASGGLDCAAIALVDHDERSGRIDADRAPVATSTTSSAPPTASSGTTPDDGDRDAVRRSRTPAGAEPRTARRRLAEDGLTRAKRGDGASSEARDHLGVGGGLDRDGVDGDLPVDSAASWSTTLPSSSTLTDESAPARRGSSRRGRRPARQWQRRPGRDRAARPGAHARSSCRDGDGVGTAVISISGRRLAASVGAVARPAPQPLPPPPSNGAEHRCAARARTRLTARRRPSAMASSSGPAQGRAAQRRARPASTHSSSPAAAGSARRCRGRRTAATSGSSGGGSCGIAPHELRTRGRRRRRRTGPPRRRRPGRRRVRSRRDRRAAAGSGAAAVASASAAVAASAQSSGTGRPTTPSEAATRRSASTGTLPADDDVDVGAVEAEAAAVLAERSPRRRRRGRRRDDRPEAAEEPARRPGARSPAPPARPDRRSSSGCQPSGPPADRCRRVGARMPVGEVARRSARRRRLRARSHHRRTWSRRAEAQAPGGTRRRRSAGRSDAAKVDGDERVAGLVVEPGAAAHRRRSGPWPPPRTVTADGTRCSVSSHSSTGSVGWAGRSAAGRIDAVEQSRRPGRRSTRDADGSPPADGRVPRDSGGAARARASTGSDELERHGLVVGERVAAAQRPGRSVARRARRRAGRIGDWPAAHHRSPSATTVRGDPSHPR